MSRPSTQEQAQILERQLKALDLRKRGFTYREIGTKLSISYVQAYRDVNGELKRLARLRDKTVEQERQLDLERIDMLIQGLEPMARVGKPDAVAMMLRAMERRAKLAGLDMPTKTENDHTSGGQPLSAPVIYLPAIDSSVDEQ